MVKFSKKQKAKRIICVPQSIDIKENKAIVTTSTGDLRLPKEIGEPHPFDYEITEGLYLKMGILSGMTDKIIDFVWGPGFHTQSKDPRAKALIDTWIQDVSFDTIGRKWLKESLIKGAGYLELSGKVDEVPQSIKNLNANHMFVRRNDKGDILGFTQAVKKMGRIEENDSIKFKPEEIAQLNFNQLGDLAYGWGLIYPSLNTINNLLKIEEDVHKLISRKANSPMIVYVGDPKDPDSIPDDKDIQAISDKLQFMNAKTEWVFPADIRAEKLDFGNIGEKFNDILTHDINLLIFAFQVPEVLLGKGNIPEGLAEVQMDAFERHIKSIQSEIEKVIEEKIFRRVLKANDIQEHVEIVWGQPSNAETIAKINLLKDLLSNPLLNMNLRFEIEKQIAELLNIEVKKLESNEEQREHEEEEPQPRVPGQRDDQHIHDHNCEYAFGKLIY